MSTSTVLTSQVSGRNAGIDIVRGVSILLVVIHHTAIRIPLLKTALAGILPRPLLMGLSWDGYEAVFVFFVVSGYLITSNAAERWGVLSKPDFRSFYVRRAARILPCLVVLVGVLALLDLLNVVDYTITRPDQSLGRAILSALLFHLNWYEGHTGYLPGGWDVLWSLSIEEAFYLGFPLVWLLIGRYRALPGVMFSILVLSLPLALNALAHAPEIWREKAYLPGMAAIATGVCAALVVIKTPNSRHPVLPVILGWLGLLLLGSLFWWEPALYGWLGNGSMLILTVGTASLMVAFRWGWGRTYAVRGTAWLRSFGMMSYEIYLTHMFVVFSVVHLFRWSGGNLKTGWVWFIPVISLSWMMGWLIDHYLSRPMDRLLRHHLGRHTSRRSPASFVHEH